ncbi:hypothetical protein K470DRAFT_260847 [Piedraia hortae CBS 480.64]|uniref:Uncharacterized protein n=1 Tax=Piedraia hortae CBS 480.64 TaxID=1314780 RepID=A0A6A7BQ26_9PEZI|nr:hypothetical protein K470DRAFT_260847 [Piedraia hortae CBS 480.64]
MYTKAINSRQFLSVPAVAAFVAAGLDAFVLAVRPSFASPAPLAAPPPASPSTFALSLPPWLHVELLRL